MNYYCFMKSDLVIDSNYEEKHVDIDIGHIINILRWSHSLRSHAHTF